MINSDLLNNKYEWFINNAEWQFNVIYETQIDKTRLWGIGLYDESEEPVRNVLSPKTTDHGWLFELALDIIQNIYNVPFDVYSLHINGQTSKMAGSIHADYGNNIIVMLTPNWRTEWGGELGIYKKEKSADVHKLQYVPGRIIFYNGEKGHKDGYRHVPKRLNESNIWHRSMAPTTICPELRITLNIRGRAIYPGSKINKDNRMEYYAEQQRIAKTI